jgi:hypothetical protein
MIMNTKILMSLSAFSMGLIGLLCTFLPDEMLMLMGLDWVKYLSLFIQVLGALYLGFAMLNWTAKANLIGGIYSKPIAMANFTHYMIGALAIVKYLMTHHDMITLLLLPLLIYVIFAICFAKVSFTSPV